MLCGCKQVTHRSSSYSLEEKQRFNAYTGEERRLDGRPQQSGEWIVELSEETDSVWVWSHISREAVWRKIRVKEIIINLEMIFFFFFYLRLRLTMCLEWRRDKCNLLWDWTPSDEVTSLILKRYLTVSAHFSAPRYLHEVCSDKYILAGCSWTTANKKCKISVLEELNSHGRSLFSSRATELS